MQSGQGCYGVPSQKGMGSVTPWQQFVMNIGAVTTAPTKAALAGIVSDLAFWRKNGSNMEITYLYAQSSATGATSGTGAYLFPIPGGYRADTAQNPVSLGGPDSLIGLGFCTGAAGSDTCIVSLNSSTNIQLYSVPSGSFIGSARNPIAGQAVIRYNFTCSVPILEFRA